FSHILNGDMRLNLRLMGIIFGILCLTVIGRILLQTRGRKNPLPVLGLALVVIGWVGVLFGRLIQAAVSRQREFLADASAVQFTRNPTGLADALKKIGGLSYGSRLESAHAEEASHMFFGNGLGNSFLGLMETHPPLAERIRALEPSFDGVFPHVSPAAVEPVMVSSPARRQPFPFPLQGQGQAAVAGLASPPVITARSVMANAGNPTTAHLRYAEELRSAIPASLQAAARDSLGASALIYGLLLSDEEATRRKQLAELAGATANSVCQETLHLYAEVQALSTHAKLPLVDLTLPALRQLSPRQFQQFRTAVQALVESDGEIDLFEYVLQKIVVRHLEPYFTKARKPVVQYYALNPLAGDCAVLLSGLAHMGHSDPAQIELAFQQGAQPLSYAAQAEISQVPAAQCELVQVDAALNRLAQAVPQIKKNVLNACAQTVAADGVIQELEAELLRAIADSLDCPLPPFIPKE
ncbi:MAG TPA: M48 family metalloprotease, partial [Candidatus Sulfotelmatobacter sp.]|nr:M48 family metalloprotease [Candidatus Sulfotelmatobacter sp.]